MSAPLTLANWNLKIGDYQLSSYEVLGYARKINTRTCILSL